MSSLALPIAPVATLALACLTSAACYHAPPVTTIPTTGNGVTTVSGVGFNGPENIVYDSVSDVFLVSNIGGGGPARDDNGFISRIAPDGRVLSLRWIAGGSAGATLDAPKGLAIRGDTLAVADIGGVHYFSRTTGAPLGSVALNGLVMNDLAFAPDGTLWITDTGPGRDKTPVDTTQDMDAVWTIAPGGTVSAVARGLSLDRPDGIVLDGDGALLVTSWDAGTVWRQSPGKPRVALLTAVTSPAGVAVDTRRHRLAVTSMQGNTMYLLPLR